MNLFSYSTKFGVLFVILVIAFLIADDLQGQSSYQKRISPDEILYNFSQSVGKGAREATEGYAYPPIWARPESSRVEPHFLIVSLQANPRIGNIPLVRGDYIGAFFVGDSGTLVCGGAGYWKADSAIIFGITGDDPQTPHKEGFSYGEVINYKLFSFATMKDYTVNVISFDTSPGSGFISGVKWYTLALSSATNVKSNVTFDVYATATPNPICIGGSSQLNATVFIGPGEPYTYSWTSIPPGFTSTLKNPVVNPTIATQYLLTAQSGALTSQHNVTVIVNQEPVVNAGTDGTLCVNSTFQLSGQATNYGNVLWSTNGDGTFNSPSILNPIYTPGTNDKQNSSVTLSISAFPLEPCLTSASDEVVLTILPIPFISLGPDALICVNSVIPLNPTAQNYLTVNWTTSGDGTFSNANIINPLYAPGSGDNANGFVNLTCSVSSTTPCPGTASDQVKYSFIKAPTASGPANLSVCETTNTIIINTSASNYSSVRWTTVGDGTFIDTTVVIGNYLPGPNDKLNGGTIVTLTALPINPCTLSATKQVNIIIKRLPIIDAGDTDKVCKNYQLQLNATASNYNGISWTTSGDGTFTNSYILNPKYTPGNFDKAVGSFILTLTGSPILPCYISSSDILNVEIVNQPTAQINTASNQLLCTTEPLN